MKDFSPFVVAFVLCGSKSDLEANRKVSRTSGEELAKMLGVSFFETSALTGSNVWEVFHQFSSRAKKRLFQRKKYHCINWKGLSTKYTNRNQTMTTNARKPIFHWQQFDNLCWLIWIFNTDLKSIIAGFSEWIFFFTLRLGTSDSIWNIGRTVLGLIRSINKRFRSFRSSRIQRSYRDHQRQ